MRIEAHEFLGLPIPVLAGEIEAGVKAITFGHLADMLCVPRWHLRATINNHADSLSGTIFEALCVEGMRPATSVYALRLEGVLTVLKVLLEEGSELRPKERIAMVLPWVMTLPETTGEAALVSDLLASAFVGPGVPWRVAKEGAEGYLSGSDGNLTTRALARILKA